MAKKNWRILTCDLNRVGKAKLDVLQSVAIATGGAMMFRTDLRHARAVPQTIIIIIAGTYPMSAKEQMILD